MINLIRIVSGIFLILLAVCLGGMNFEMWEMVFWPQSAVMQKLQWTTAFIALLGTALTVFIGGLGIFVLSLKE